MGQALALLFWMWVLFGFLEALGFGFLFELLRGIQAFFGNCSIIKAAGWLACRWVVLCDWEMGIPRKGQLLTTKECLATRSDQAPGCFCWP
jgi:hypothetical protein